MAYFVDDRDGDPLAHITRTRTPATLLLDERGRRAAAARIAHGDDGTNGADTLESYLERPWKRP